jgi:hypothetical protein
MRSLVFFLKQRTMARWREGRWRRVAMLGACPGTCTSREELSSTRYSPWPSDQVHRSRQRMRHMRRCLAMPQPARGRRGEVRRNMGMEAHLLVGQCSGAVVGAGSTASLSRSPWRWKEEQERENERAGGRWGERSGFAISTRRESWRGGEHDRATQRSRPETGQPWCSSSSNQLPSYQYYLKHTMETLCSFFFISWFG